MRGRVLLPLLIFCAAGASAQSSRRQLTSSPLPMHFEIDAAHSMMGFSVGFMGLSKVRGAFASFGGTIMNAPDDARRSSASLIMLTRSVSTNNTTRDNHLRSPDFFDATKYPYITFRSTSIRRTRTGYLVAGDFSMHGVTKHLSIPFTLLNAPMSDAWGNQRMTLQGNMRLSRKEYGINGTAFWNSEFDPGRMAVSDNVDVELLVSATIPNVDKWADPVGDSLLTEIKRQGASATLSQLKAARATNPKIDSISPFAYMLAAEKLAKAGQLTEAAEVYTNATELKPDAPVLLARRAALTARMGDTAAAIDLFERVGRIDSTSTIAYEWLRVLRARK